MSCKEQNNIFFFQEDDYLYLSFLNKITAIYSFSLKKYLTILLDSKKIKTIWIDLSKCTYVDSTTIGALIQIHNMIENINGKLILCNLSERINKIMENAHLKKFLNIRVEDTLLTLEEKLINSISLKSRDDITEEFIIDTHNDIIKIAPDLKEEFSSLLSILTKKD